MTINPNKQVNVNGTVFSFAQFASNPDNYMELIRPLFRSATLIMRDGMDRLSFLNNLFCLMYYKKGLSYSDSSYVESAPTTHRSRRSIRTNDAQFHILSALGIDTVKRNPKISKVMFKNSGITYKMKTADMDYLANHLKKSIDLSRNNLNVSIGVELEFIGNRSKVAEFNNAMINLTGRYEYKGLYNKNPGKDWVLGYDGSINHTDGYPSSGFELTSPILHFNNKDMNELKAVIDLIKDILDGRINKSCGTHIHMSFDCGIANKELCAYFGKSYRYNEESLFDQLVPNNRRQNHSRWCRTTLVDPTPGSSSQRYHKLNFANVKKNSNNLHLEFRQLDGTLDYDKIHAWIKLQKIFCELTMDSWKEARKENVNPSDEDPIKQLEVSDFVISDEMDASDTESIMKMARLIA